MLESTPTMPEEQKFMGKRTKIVGTLGPSSSDYETQKKLVESGLNIARLNFSHGDHATHMKNINSIRKIASELSMIKACDDLLKKNIRVDPVQFPLLAPCENFYHVLYNVCVL